LRKHIPAWLVAVAAAAILATACEASADEWECDLGLYAWLAGIDGDIGMGRVSGVPVNASFSDLASYLDFSAAAYFEARQPKYILATDVFYVNLGAERSAFINGATVDVELDMTQWVIELGGAYRVRPDLDAWLAGRLYSVDAGSSFQGSQLRGGSREWVDVFVGARYHRHFAERWVASARADVGAGGSDFAWFANAVIGYEFTRTFTLGAGYRVLSVDRETGSGDEYFKYDIVMDGVGIVLQFALR
jgi:hypothetical protein